MGFWHVYFALHGIGGVPVTDPNDGWRMQSRFRVAISETRNRLAISESRDRVWIANEKAGE